MQLQPRRYTLKIEDMIFMAGKPNNEGVSIFEEGIIANRAGVFFLEGFLGDAVEFCRSIDD